MYVRYLNWNGKQWNWNYNWLDNNWDANNPAAVLAIFLGPFVLFVHWFQKTLERTLSKSLAEDIASSIICYVAILITWAIKPIPSVKWWYPVVAFIPLCIIGVRLARKLRESKKIKQEWKEPIFLGWLLPFFGAVIIRPFSPNIHLPWWLFIGGWIIGSLLIWLFVGPYRLRRQPKQ